MSIYTDLANDADALRGDEWVWFNRRIDVSRAGDYDEAFEYLRSAFYTDSKIRSRITAVGFCRAMAFLWPLIGFLTFFFARRSLKDRYHAQLKLLSKVKL